MSEGERFLEQVTEELYSEMLEAARLDIGRLKEAIEELTRAVREYVVRDQPLFETRVATVSHSLMDNEFNDLVVMLAILLLERAEVKGRVWEGGR